MGFGGSIKNIPTPVQKKQETSVLHNLVSLQSFNGSFMLNDPLCAIIGKPLNNLQAGKNISKGYVANSQIIVMQYNHLSFS